MKPDLRQALRDHILIGDGAMGTYLYQLGFPVGISYEELNTTRPDVVENVHRQYVQAGARVIETNTFSANREKLARFGLESEVKSINRAGAAIARKAAGAEAYVVGAIGSIRAGKRRNVVSADLRVVFQEQAEALLEEDIDGILLETFYEYEEMRLALNVVRKLTGLTVICQFATDGGDTTADGLSFREAFARLAAEGADIVGFNCHSGPNGIIRSLQKSAATGEMPYSVFPNAGLPSYVDGKYTFGSPPSYFAENARAFADLGVRLIGGCCGTTPEHIAAMAEALRDYVPRPAAGPAERGETEPSAPGEAIVLSERNAAATSSAADHGAHEPTLVDLVKRRHTVIVELDPPRDLDTGKYMTGARALRDAGVDAITMADNSLAMTRMSNMSLGFLVKEKIGIRPLLHLTCRDRNLIGTQSHLMGLHALGIDHVLALTGDPPRFGDLPGASSVYDMTSFELIRMIKQLNEGMAFSGKPLKHKAKFVVGVAFNPNVKHLDKAIRRLEKKIESGADFVMTQPVYDHALIETLHEATKHLPIPVFIGIMPIVSGANAEFMHNEVPGVVLTDDVRRRMAGLKGEEGRAVGIQIAKELLDTAIRYFNGIYLMTPMLWYDMSVQLTQYVWERTNIARSASGA